MKPFKDWIKWLLHEDRRKAERAEEHGLHAHYWDGGPPQSRHVRDISFTGLYLHTEEQWSPGTLVKLTLQKTDSIDGDTERAITVLGQVVRSGVDGVGMRFVLPAPSRPSQDGPNSHNDGAGRKDFDRFMKRNKGNQI